MLQFICLVARLVVATFCFYALWYLSPGVSELTSTPNFYETKSENSFWENIQGVEWVVLATIFFLLSFTGLHCIFWNLIRNKSKIISKRWRDIFVKSIDYIWYLGSLASVLLALGDLNSQEANRYLTEIANNKVTLQERASKYIQNSKESCDTLQVVSVKDVVLDLDDEDYAEDILHYENDFEFFRSLCNYTKQGNYRRTVLSCAKHSEYWGWGNNEPTYWRSSFKKDGIANALNHMDSLCATTGRIEYLSDQEIMYENAANRFLESTSIPTAVWLVLLPIIVAFRTVKTTAELSDTIAKKYH